MLFAILRGQGLGDVQQLLLSKADQRPAKQRAQSQGIARIGQRAYQSDEILGFLSSEQVLARLGRERQARFFERPLVAPQIRRNRRQQRYVPRRQPAALPVVQLQLDIPDQTRADFGDNRGFFVSRTIDSRLGRKMDGYRFDPEQDYVVVDIETTGSWSNGDRITEIGAVKVRNHRVVDEWHSLLNPQRSIPAKIVQLTGITNEMVRDAPLFAEVADRFMEFMGDGIFVAHNVSFDYGFLAYEFERIGRRFRFPKLCTCAGMRRRYPGHKSYGLGKLCEIYGISLDNHHRALCDARASAQLLNLINQKRNEESYIGEAA
ncbi:3'-5' exonuclease [Bradyrhizobium diazoefficiens]|uniref:DNA-directed DNA polymerase n=1 Tax=Bradyrhizobium diazoefficiens TaxID=1355477 RepID=A0A810BK68_9BRAD|nr:hypothetical protein XF8B_73470 [Bradyrhizobium diazoefficiens]